MSEYCDGQTTLVKTLNCLMLTLVFTLVVVGAAYAQDEAQQAQATEECLYEEGHVLPQEELQEKLMAHKEWLDSEGWNDPAVPGKAVLCNVDLSWANLSGRDLREANLEGATLSAVNLKGANLSAVNLAGASLGGANLEGATLSGVNLKGAHLYGANLKSTDLPRANLEGATLSGVNLKDAYLRTAKLRGAKLVAAYLEGADLAGADLEEVELDLATLKNAILTGANLKGAKLQGANLEGAKLGGANLASAEVNGATLKNAILTGANLKGAKLQGANLEGAKLGGANLASANLSKASLEAAALIGANLGGAKLGEANLKDSDLIGADLTGAYLNEANLVGAKLSKTNFENATLGGTNLDKAHLDFVNLTRATYGPIGKPHDYVEGIKGLDTVSVPRGYEDSELRISGLLQLRKLLQEAGLRDREREATYAIERSQTHHALATWAENPLVACLAALRLIFVEWPTGYGLYPFGAFLILLGFIVIFALIYITALATNTGTICRIWPAGRLQWKLGGPELVKDPHVEELIPWGPLGTLGHALQFSLLSAFHIGFRELNVGNWIARLQSREYVLQAVGWVRVVAGVQSLLSVYLLAIWALTYFGRPFQ